MTLVGFLHNHHIFKERFVWKVLEIKINYFRQQIMLDDYIRRFNSISKYELIHMYNIC